MKKINDKGFTLTEVLAVIAILTILALLVTAGIMGYFRKGKDDYNEKLAGQLVLAGKQYFSEHKEELPTSVNGKDYAYVTLPALQSTNNVTEEFVDADHRECSPSYVYVKQRPNNPKEYDYYPCLVCQDKDGKEVLYGKSKYCDPKNWADGKTPANSDDPIGPINPEQPDDTTQCEYVNEGENTKITKAVMPAGILKITYIPEDGSDPIIVWQASDETNKPVTVSNLQVDTIPETAEKVEMWANADTKVECSKGEGDGGGDQGNKPSDGTPVCTFYNIPSGWTKATTLTPAPYVTCESTDSSNAKLPIQEKGGKSYIVQDKKSYGTLKKGTPTKTETQITYNLTFTTKKKTEGQTTITVQEGTVKNLNDERVNTETTAVIKSDRKWPVITYKPSGTKRKATALKYKKKAYKNKVTIKITCSDGGSGVKKFEVKLGSGSWKTIDGTTYEKVKEGRGTYKYQARCTDNVGHIKTVKKSYKVIEYGTSKSKCGCAKKKCTSTRTNYGIKHLAYGPIVTSCKYGSSWTPGPSTCNEHHLGGMSHRCNYAGPNKYQQETGYCGIIGTTCTNYKCTKAKSCWY